MTLTLAHVVIDSADAARLAGFWSEVLGRPVAAGASPYFAVIPPAGPGAPAFMFIAVPERKAGKNRVHVDLVAADWRAEADRVVGLGAEKVGEFAEYGTEWVTLRDPEGNEFDIGAAVG